MAGTGESNLDTAFLAGGGQLGELMRGTDWSRTPLGAASNWPLSLKTVVRIMLTSSQPIWIGWGPDLLYLYNDPYKSIIGGKHPWALGRPTAEVWHELWQDIRPRLQSAMNGDGTFDESQLLIMERNGYPEETYYTYSYSPIPGDDGQPAGIICANSDETRRVISERQLALLRHVAADSANARTVDAALQGCIRAMGSNDKDLLFALVYLRPHGGGGLRLAGYTGAAGQSGDSGAAWLNFIESMDPLDAPWRAETVMQSGQPQQVDALPGGVQWPCGAWKTPAHRAMVLPIAPSGDAGQEGVMIIGLNPYRLADVRYQDFLTIVAQQVSAAIANAQAYEMERRRAEELEALDRAKTQFFSNVSHEFRTPLTLMLGPLADALAEPSLLPATRQQLGMAQRNVLRLSKLVNALLAFSRIEAGRQEAVFRPTDLARFTKELASSFQSAMDKAGLRYEVHCQALSQPVYVDREQWEKVVLNLLSNALKFTFEGEVALHLYDAQGQAVLEVSDTGVGVPQAELPHLFERFHRVQGTHGRTHEGSGIGLALVQDIVALHGGRVEARSELGQGSTFTVRVPLGAAHLPPGHVDEQDARQALATQADTYVQETLRWLPEKEGVAPTCADHTSAAGALQGERYRATWGARIVLADDNADMRQYVAGLLRPYYRVELAAHGEEALKAIRRERPALVLSDVMMPKLDGFGLLAAIRADAQLRTLPVVLLSARAGEEATVEGLERGADDYLIKPFTARELLARVAAIIELDRVRRATEEQVRLSLAGARLFTWDLTLATSELNVSANAAEVLGMLPRSLAEAVSALHPDDRQRHETSLAHAATNQTELWDEVRHIRPDNGETRWLELRGKVMSDGRRSPVSVSGIAFDVTERKRLEQVLRDSDRRKDEFLAMLAHELRNPLAPIRHAGELMLRMGPLEPRMHKAVEIINRQAEQLTRMVDDLLDVSRITQGRIELKKEPVALPAVIAAAIEAAEPAILHRRHALSVNTAQPLVVTGDAQRLQQCVVNLLMNAAKYTDPGGRINVDLSRDGDEAVIRVEDSGVGIAADALSAVFELFVQSERTLDRANGGLGIGLSIVKRLIEMHGGKVRAISKGMGQGATFEIRLGLAQQPALEHASPAPAGIARQRVLVVDDNQDAAESLSLVLEAEGHAVRTVFSGPAALEMVRQWTPDVVFLDIGLPEINGYEVGRQLRATPALHATRLVALTGYGQPADKQRAQEVGFNAHLIKPAAWEDIAQALNAPG